MRTADDARYRPRPGDTRRENGWGTIQVATRATDWAVEFEYPDARDPAATREVVSLAKWATERGALGVTWTPKARTAEDARFDPLPGDTRRVVLSPSEVAYARVVTRDGDSVEVQVGTSVGDWSLDFWAGGGLGDVWTPAS